MAGEGQEVSSLYVRLGLTDVGVKEGLSKLNREMKVVGEEMKLASAKLGDFANKEDILKARTDGLTKQLEAQKEKVKLLGAAFAEANAKIDAKKANGEKYDTKALQDLQIKLTMAQTKEAQLKNAIDAANREIKEQTDNAKKLGNELEHTGKKAGGLGQMLKNAFSFTVGYAMFDLIRDGFKAAGAASIGFNADLEQNQIAFETMLGSATKAQTFLDGLQQFAAKTPFEFPELVDASKKMLAFGFDVQKIPSMLKAIGDASAGLGMKGSEGLNRIGIALGQMSAKGKVSAQEMMQLTEAGIPAWDILAKAMGKSTGEVMKLSEKGLLPAKEAIDTLVSGMEERFPNMMDKQSKSFSGLMSSLKDNINLALGAGTKNIFDSLKGILDGLVAKTSQFSTVLKDKGLKEALKTMMPAPTVSLLLGFRDGLNWIITHGGAVKTGIVGIGTALLTIKFATMITDMNKTIVAAGGVRNALRAMITVNPTILAVGAVVGVLAGIAYMLYRNWEQVPPFFRAMWSVVENSFKTAWNSIKVVLRGMQVGVAEYYNFILGGMTKMVSGMLGLFANIPGIGAAFKAAQGGVDRFSESLQGFVDSSKASLNEAIADTKASASATEQSWEQMKKAGADLGKAIASDLAGMMKQAKGALTGGMKDLTQGFNTETPSLEKAGENLGAAVGKGIANGVKKSADPIKSELARQVIELNAQMEKLLQSTGNSEKDLDNITKAMAMEKQKIALLQQEYDHVVAIKGKKSEAANTVLKALEAEKKAYSELGTKIKDITEKINAVKFEAELNKIDAKIKTLSADTDNYNTRLKNLTNMQQLTQEKLSLLNKRYADVVKAQGANSEAAKELTKDIDTEKNAYAELGKQIVETNEKIAKNELDIKLIQIDARIKALSADTDSYTLKINNLTKAQELEAEKIKLLTERYNAVVKAQGANSDEAKELTKSLEDEKNAYAELGRSIEETTEKSINDLNKRVKDALKERYEAEEKVREESLEKELDDLDKWQNESEKRISAVYDAKINAIEEASKAQEKALQAELDALDRQEKEAQRAESDNQELSKIENLRSKIEYEHNEYNKAAMQQELNKLIQEREKRLHDEQLEDKKESIKQQIDAVKDNADQSKKALEDSKKSELDRIKELYTAQKESLQEQQEALKQFYETKLKDAALEAESEKLIIENNQKEIVELLKGYGKEYEVAGQTLGDRLAAGFKGQIDKIKDIISSISKEIDNAWDKTNAAAQAKNALDIIAGGNYSVTNNSTSKTVVNNSHVTINSPTARTPAEERRAWEKTQRKLAFEMGG